MNKFFDKIANNRLFEALRLRFKGFWTLVMMQLKEQLSFSFKADKKGTLTRVILLFLAFAGITFAISMVVYILGLLGVLGNGVLPVSMFNVIFYLIIILNFFSCLHRMSKSLYFSLDNQTLLSYPANSGIIFLSKVLVFYFIELFKNIFMTLPLLLAYGIVNSFPWFYYPWLILIFLLVTLLPVALGGILSIPYMGILTFMKKSQYAQCVLALALLGGIAFLVFFLISKIPPDLKISTNWASVYYPNIVKATQNIEIYSGPLFYIGALFFGYRGYKYNSNPRTLPIINDRTWIILLALISIISLGLLLSYLLARPLFFKMATKPFEYKKKIINHNYKLRLSEKNIHDHGFKAKLVYPIEKKDIKGITSKLSRLLNTLDKEEKLFIRQKISEKRILRFLNKYSKDIKFEIVPKREIVDFGYVIEIRHGTPFLVLAKNVNGVSSDCYDPHYLRKKNRVTNSFLSNFMKDLLIDIRNPGVIVSNFFLFIITPLAISLLNAIFMAINASFRGQTFIIMFNILIVLLISLASNVSMASIYSKEGSASYMLKASPSNYMQMLTSKLVLRSLLMIGSIILSCVLYSNYNNVAFANVEMLCISFIAIYLGHLLWCAELDFMHPMDHLYSEIGVNVNNPNERIAAVLTFVISFAFMGISWFFITREVSSSFLKIMLISLGFLLIRAILFTLKIRGYGTSRAENRGGR